MFPLRFTTGQNMVPEQESEGEKAKQETRGTSWHPPTWRQWKQCRSSAAQAFTASLQSGTPPASFHSENRTRGRQVKHARAGLS